MKISCGDLSGILIVLWVTFICGTGLYAQESGTINLQCQEMPLKDVVDSISRQTEYTIHVESDLLAMPVTGKFSNEKIGPLLRRIFKGKNISLLFSDQDKVCIVRTFGEKGHKYYMAGSGGADPLIGMQPKDLAASQEEQLKAFRKFSQDPDSVDSLTGLKLREIEASWQNQRDAFIQSQKNDSVDTLTGITMGQLKASRKKQQQYFQAYSDDVNSIDSITGQKLVDINRSRKMQRKAFHKYSNNPDSVDPLTGLTLGQIRESQRRQLGKL